MKSFVSVNEVNELCEALILDFIKSTKHICVDIEGFITDYLNLNIVYIPFAERKLKSVLEKSPAALFEFDDKCFEMIVEKVYIFPGNKVVFEL